MYEGQEIVILDSKNLTKSIIKVNKEDIRPYLLKEQINEVLRTMPAGKYKMIIQTLWMTGIRVTELINIKKGDIDFLNSRITIKWLKSRRWNHRIIPIRVELKDLLQFYTAAITNEDKVFPFSRQWVYEITKKYLESNPHVLRHSFAVNFLEQCKSGKSLIILKELLGHRHIQTTMEYLRIVPNDLAYELDKIQFN